ncbi:PBSX family phage terminase large subunit [Clostridium botulinum]|uniref:PBSX family phage terminase large subunit n=1 Tax=Clostridium botulinum TaxID=1491 RepID=A0A846K0S0_CLOBO|nr:PBSX family phage terminase large subunit [Clostridium botulinum]KAI3346254.1 PBSX family phage terminase large subunit [Clostridium botulinum]KOM88867.1 terminase [Clostridium botulinum]KOR57704.1 terminase [Clostridium botulinum]NFE13038.1 PBSX family phage terminase large subunit [Clostridium botulinum]NFE85662.1 PBSX family phage terminase large subunit [Clostridium botulinum]
MDIEREINPHFEDYIFNWDYKFYFLVGGYGSSKSYNTAFKLILKLLEEKRTALVVREVYDTMRDSCYSLLEEIITEMELDDTIQCKTSPMQIRFPNGSKIIFKGMDKPAKLKSINNVSIVWIEECSEVKYEGFKELLGRLRHPTLKLHMILTTNPVSKSNWCYKYFFIDKKKKLFVLDDKDLYKKRIVIKNNTYYHHSLADDNYFLPKSYILQLDDLKTHDKDLWRVARKGQFGTNGKKVLPQFEKKPHYKVLEMMHNTKKLLYRVGMDFGFETSYNAVVRLAIDDDSKILYIYWQYYKNQMTDDKTAIELEEFKKTQERIKADSAEPKTITFYRQEGFNMLGAKKFKGSRLQNTKKVKRFKKIICSEECTDVIDELEDLTYAVDKDGEIIKDEFNIDPHTFSAIWYALDGYEVSNLKEHNYDNEVYKKGKGVVKNNASDPYGRKGGTIF